MEALQLLRTTPPINHHHHNHQQLALARRGSSPLSYSSTEPSMTMSADPVVSTALGQTQNIDQHSQTSGPPAGTIVAIVFSGLILISLLIGTYACASSHHRSRRGWCSTPGRRSHYEDEDIEMQPQRHTRQSRLAQLDEDDSTDQEKCQHEPYHHQGGAGMGYDDEDGREAWIKVGTARVARMRRVPAGSVSIRNIGRSKAPAPLGSSQSMVRDVVTLPDLAWAETLTTGGGRRPGVVISVAATSPPSRPPQGAPPPSPPSTARASWKSSSSSEQSRRLQERSESRKAVKRKAISEWCARGSGGGLGPYSGLA